MIRAHFYNTDQTKTELPLYSHVQTGTEFTPKKTIKRTQMHLKMSELFYFFIIIIIFHTIHNTHNEKLGKSIFSCSSPFHILPLCLHSLFTLGRHQRRIAQKVLSAPDELFSAFEIPCEIRKFLKSDILAQENFQLRN